MSAKDMNELLGVSWAKNDFLLKKYIISGLRSIAGSQDQIDSAVTHVHLFQHFLNFYELL